MNKILRDFSLQLRYVYVYVFMKKNLIVQL